MDSLKQVWSKLQQRWQGVSKRERLYLKIAGVFVVLLLINYMIYTPLSNAVSNIKTEFSYQQDLVQWMQPRVQTLRGNQSKQQVQAVSAGELLPTIDNRLKSASFARTAEQVTQTNDNQVRVNFTDVPFDQLLSWLVTQWQTSRITVISIDAEKGSKEGLANVNLVLGISI